MTRAIYPRDLTETEWQRLEPLIPVPAKPGRPRKYPLRAMLHAIFYLMRTGCPWRYLPHDLPQWKTVPHDVRLWRQSGLGAALNATVRQTLRVVLGRDAQPRAGIMYTQSVKTTGGGGERGYDGAKNIKGRKRHLLVDTQGLVRACTVPAADVLDRAGVPLVLSPEETPAQGPRLAHIGLDAGSKGTGKGKDWMEKACDWLTDTVRPPSRCVLVFEEGEPAPRPAFTVLPRRWAVERPFAWLGQSRRLSKDYERLCETSEAMISATMRRRMIRRLPAA